MKNKLSNHSVSRHFLYPLLAAVLRPLYYMPCIKFKTWAISGRAILDDDLWNNKLAKVGVWKKYFLIYDDYQHGS